MKKSHKCPKCGSNEIAMNLPIADKMDPGVDANQQIKIATTPRNIFFKGMEAFEIRAYVCLECGFMEQYVSNHSRFSRAYKRSKAPKK